MQGSINAYSHLKENPASISARNRSRRVTFFFIASRRPGMAGCLGISRFYSKRCPSVPYQAESIRFLKLSLTKIIFSPGDYADG